MSAAAKIYIFDTKASVKAAESRTRKDTKGWHTETQKQHSREQMKTSVFEGLGMMPCISHAHKESSHMNSGKLHKLSFYTAHIHSYTISLLLLVLPSQSLQEFLPLLALKGKGGPEMSRFCSR